ncbi:hypothetical protein [Agromyces atrinae]|uniref:Uncharacterized protein n=1 Tax=Agromyces atrinae TaxID=592376 RepID=A0A4V1R2J9_9MICO|nr:hypothetical protein [Agromyces atrinae]NYD66757.1 hypothetical protein [Agromyces atrinae]RXZ87416.1 hypothetical protein ESP50_05715 [Agromyces atrinae]
MSDGWGLIERTEFAMTMGHLVTPPAWRIALDVINPLAWIIGAGTYPEVFRTLHVTVDEDGTLTRTTTGEIPPRWTNKRSWEVPDGIVTL